MTFTNPCCNYQYVTLCSELNNVEDLRKQQSNIFYTQKNQHPFLTLEPGYTND